MSDEHGAMDKRTTPAEGATSLAAIPNALWPFIQHHPDCVLKGHWMEAADHSCDCGLADALTSLTPATDEGLVDVLRGIEVARTRIAPLMKQGEDAIWRPAQFAYEVLGNAAAALANREQSK